MPLWFVALPPLIDLLGHIGRYHIQLGLADSPALQANWAYHWSLIGNLGCDLLMELLGRLFGVECGAVVLAGLILVVMISGMARLARAAHGKIPATAWAAFPFAMSYAWHYGLVNYWLGAGCALHAAAFFYARRNENLRPGVGSSALLGAVSAVLWITHIYGWAVFAVLIWARMANFSSWRAHAASLARLLPLSLPLILIVALGYGRQGHAAETMGWFKWSFKFTSLAWSLRDQSEPFDVGCVIFAIMLIAGGLSSRLFERDTALVRAMLVLLAALFALPEQLFGSAYADAPPVAANLHHRLARLTAGAGGAAADGARHRGRSSVHFRPPGGDNHARFPGL